MDLGRWRDIQRLELDWHREHPWRANDALFLGSTREFMAEMGFKPDDFKTVIDAGCGPRLRSRFFNAEIIAIEPLAKEYAKTLPWSDLYKASVMPYPLEEFIPGLKAEFLVCLNCLDHVYDFDKAIENISKYAPLLFLSFDCDAPDPMHPLSLKEEISESVFERHGLKVTKKMRSAGWRAGYAINYWLESANAK